LKEAGYLLMPVPRELGGYGMSLAEVTKIKRELAYRAAPTALAITIHLFWMGAITDLWPSAID
jgi:alkylation response protein AidB-like acyl-CoA dehydrogenase